VGLDHISSEGVHTRVAGPKSKPLARAVARLATAEPIDDLAPLIAAGEVAKVEWAELSAPLRRGVPWATIAIVLACLGMFGLAGSWGGDCADCALDRIGAWDGAAVRHDAVWRLLSRLFLHRGAGHLIGNMFGLVILGPFLEWTLGARRFVLLYALAGLIGSI